MKGKIKRQLALDVNFGDNQWRHQKFFCGGGASKGQNAILRGQKSQNLPKMADFGHFFLLRGGGSVRIANLSGPWECGRPSYRGLGQDPP